MQPASPGPARIRRAEPADAAELARILPSGAPPSEVCRRFVAAAPDGKLTGAAMLGLGRLGFWAELACDDDEPATAKALQAALSDAARSRGARRLLALGLCAAGDARDRLFSALGYDRRSEIERWRIDVAEALPAARRFCQRLPAPADLRVVTLDAAPARAVAKLRQRYLGGDLRWLERRLRDARTAGAYDAELSRVALRGERVAALWLALSLSPELGYVDSLVVSPTARAQLSSRSAGCAPFLTRDALAAAWAVGKRFLEMEIDADKKLMRSVPVRVGGTLIERKVRLGMELAAPEPPSDIPDAHRPIWAVVGYPRAGADAVADLLRAIGLRPAPGSTEGRLRQAPRDPAFWSAAQGCFLQAIPQIAAGFPGGHDIRILRVIPAPSHDPPLPAGPATPAEHPALTLRESDIKSDLDAVRHLLRNCIAE